MNDGAGVGRRHVGRQLHRARRLGRRPRADRPPRPVGRHRLHVRADPREPARPRPSRRRSRTRPRRSSRRGRRSRRIVNVPAGRQLRFDDVVTYLGTTLDLPIPSGREPGRDAPRVRRCRGARAHVQPEPGRARRRDVRRRVPGGRAAARATSEAWVYGLRQDALARSNLAIADARVGRPRWPSRTRRPLRLRTAEAARPCRRSARTPSRAASGCRSPRSSRRRALASGYARVRPAGGDVGLRRLRRRERRRARRGRERRTAATSRRSRSRPRRPHVRPGLLGEGRADPRRLRLAGPRSSGRSARRRPARRSLGTTSRGPTSATRSKPREGLIFLFGDTIGHERRFTTPATRSPAARAPIRTRGSS